MATREYQFAVAVETDTLPTAPDPVANTDGMTLGYANTTYARRLSWFDSRQTAQNVRDIASADRADAQLVWCDALLKLFYFDAASALGDNGTSILAPTVGTGRWLAVPAAGTPLAPMDFYFEGVLEPRDVIGGARYINQAATLSQIGFAAEDRGDTGTTTIRLWRNRYGGGVSGSTSQDATFAGAAGGGAAVYTFGTAIAYVVGDYVTVESIDVANGAVTNLGIRLIFT